MAAPGHRTVAFVGSVRDPVPADDRLVWDVPRGDAAPATVFEAAAWDDPEVDWARFDLVVLRSPWDYMRHVERFVAWIRALPRPERVCNPPDVVAWNANKGYLRELSRESGVRVPETVFVEAAGGDEAAAGAVAAAADAAVADVRSRGWERCVVKPAVSNSAHATSKHDCDGPGLVAAARNLRGILRKAAGAAVAGVRGPAALVQSYVPEVTGGELSFVFLGGAASHCVRKIPGAGDFRTQEHFGASVVGEDDPPPSAAAAARRVMDALARLHPGAAPLLYARVDLVVGGDGEATLMELEVIEPSLFLDRAAAAPAAFRRAIEARLEAMG